MMKFKFPTGKRSTSQQPPPSTSSSSSSSIDQQQNHPSQQQPSQQQQNQQQQSQQQQQQLSSSSNNFNSNNLNLSGLSNSSNLTCSRLIPNSNLTPNNLSTISTCSRSPSISACSSRNSSRNSSPILSNILNSNQTLPLVKLSNHSNLISSSTDSINSSSTSTNSSSNTKINHSIINHSNQNLSSSNQSQSQSHHHLIINPSPNPQSSTPSSSSSIQSHPHPQSQNQNQNHNQNQQHQNLSKSNSIDPISSSCSNQTPLNLINLNHSQSKLDSINQPTNHRHNLSFHKLLNLSNSNLNQSSTFNDHQSKSKLHQIQDHHHHHHHQPTSNLPHHNIMVSKKTRRKSYGGLRAILGISKSIEPPPLPIPPQTASSIIPQHLHQKQHLPHHLNRHHHHPSLDTSTSPSSSLIDIPRSPSPSLPLQTRQSISSLKPFPFLSGIRRKSANSNNSKLTQQNISTQVHSPSIQTLTHTPQSRPISPTSLFSNLTKNDKHQSNASTLLPNRVYAFGSSKKAQSVDDLSQFGLLPKPRIKPRHSEELFENRQASNLHNGLDQIGELAGSLAAIPGSSKTEDRQPRLSNPKAMRTVYGVSIDDLYWRDGDEFPLLVDVLVELIEKKGIDQQGIYRVPGEKRVIENLQASIDERGVKGVNIWQDSFKDVHNLSGALKLFLREIPGGVIPFDRYDQFLAVNAITEESERTCQLQSHVKDLPIPNKILLLKLVKHFERVVAHAESNSMLVHNVAIVFAPSLFRSGSEHSNPLLSMQNIGKASAIVRHLIVHADKIFGQIDELLKSLEIERVQKEKSSIVEQVSGTPQLISNQTDQKINPRGMVTGQIEPLPNSIKSLKKNRRGSKELVGKKKTFKKPSTSSGLPSANTNRQPKGKSRQSYTAGIHSQSSALTNSPTTHSLFNSSSITINQSGHSIQHHPLNLISSSTILEHNPNNQAPST